MSNTAREFEIGDILTVTTGIMMSRRGSEGLHDIIGFMVGEALPATGLVMMASSCEKELLRQHPQLKNQSTPEGLNDDTLERWLKIMEREYGKTLVVHPLKR